MARFYGKIGFGITEEKTPGVFQLCITEKSYYGDVLKNHKSYEKGEGLNDDFNINNTFSIIADKFAYDYLYAMRYVEYFGVKWKIKSADVEYPRLILTVGEIYK